MSEIKRVIVVGGGAAGFFAAIACAEKLGAAGEVTIYEATAHPLAKVRVSGGGRCNVTHACFEPRELVKRYPRGRARIDRGVSPLATARHDRVVCGARRGNEDRGGRPDVSGDGRFRDDRRLPESRGRKGGRADRDQHGRAKVEALGEANRGRTIRGESGNPVRTPAHLSG